MINIKNHKKNSKINNQSIRLKSQPEVVRSTLYSIMSKNNQAESLPYSNLAQILLISINKKQIWEKLNFSEKILINISKFC